MNCYSTNYVCLKKYLAWVSVHSCQEAALLGKECRTDFRRNSAANIFFWHPGNYPSLESFTKLRNPLNSHFWKSAAPFWGRQTPNSKKMHIYTCTALPMLYHALLACGCPLCFSRELCFPTGQNCHLSQGCSVLWPKLQLLHSRNSILPLGEVIHGWLLHVSCICCGGFHRCPTDCSLPFSSSGIISQEVLHYLPTSLPQGRRQHLHRTVTLHISNPGESSVWVKLP